MTAADASANNVDMLAEAREAQWSALSFMGPGAIKLVAPAKVNLFLDIRDRRSDGYHEVANVMHSLALHDVLYMQFEPERADGDDSEGLQISVETAIKDCGAPSPDEVDAHFPLGAAADDATKNLAYKAVRLLANRLAEEMPDVEDAVDAAEATGAESITDAEFAARTTLIGAMTIRIEKHIPAQAGLGGGSTDAAAALLGAAALWDIPKDSPVVRDVAAKLGADVAFFLDGGCALLGGTGERMIHTLTPMKAPVVLVKPPTGVSTAEAYRLFDEDPVRIPAETVTQAEAATNAADVPLANNLTRAATTALPVIGDIMAWLSAMPGVADGSGAPEVLLCGSGSTVFAITESYSDALVIAAAAQKQGWWARATTLSSLPAAKVG